MSAPERTLAGPRRRQDPRASQAEALRHGVNLELSGFAARIVSNCSRIVHYVASLYPTAVVEATGTVDLAPPFAVVERSLDAGGCFYRLTAQGADVGRFATATDAVAHLEYVTNAAAALGLGRFLLLHAGAVASGRGAIVLPGSSGVGKSTLVTALCLAGFHYLSDELAVVDSEFVVVRPFLKPICLKEGGWRILASTVGLPLTLRAIRADGQQVQYLRPPHPCSPESALPIGYVITPLRRSCSGATLTPTTRAEALAELARHSLNLPRYGPAGLELLAQLVERAECYRLTYDTPADAVSILSGLVGDGPNGSCRRIG